MALPMQKSHFSAGATFLEEYAIVGMMMGKCFLFGMDRIKSNSDNTNSVPSIRLNTLQIGKSVPMLHPTLK